MVDPGTVLKGLRSPHKAIRYAYEQTEDQRLELQRHLRHVPNQRPRLHDFVDRDEFVLVILDACRYDAFMRAIDGRMGGWLSKVWASGHCTAEYTRETWTDDHSLTYLAAGPVLSDFYFENRGLAYRPSEHLGDLVPLWKTHWDLERGTVPAKAVTDVALDRLAQGDRSVVAHYIQPHVPHIGVTENLPWETVPETIAEAERKEHGHGREVAVQQDGGGPASRIHEQVTQGDLSDSRLIRGYYHNLEYVLDEVERLVRHAPCPVVITSDHGEHLGEGGRYLHRSESPITREVPWFTVDESERGVESLQSATLRAVNVDVDADPDDDLDDEEVMYRLENLGYMA